MWLHGDWPHLIGNLIGLLMMSVLLVRALGFDRFLLLYLCSGLAGSVFSVAVERADLAVGASGAIFGLTGALAVYAVWPMRVFHELEVTALREALLPIVALDLLFSFLPGVSWGGHLGGFLFGAAVAGSGLLHLGLPPRATGAEPGPVRWFVVAVVTVAVLALASHGN